MTTPFLKDSVNALWRGLLAASGVTVVYEVDNTAGVSLQAIPGSTQTEVDYGDGYVKSNRSLDFIFEASAFVTDPEVNDRIVWDGRTYQVLSFDVDRHYREIGPFKTLYRVHTKEMTP